jgi:hypothetical protein
LRQEILGYAGELKYLEAAKEDFEIARIKTELSQIRQALVERTDLHFLRKLHSWLLCGLLIIWVMAVWCAIALQGFGHIPFLFPRMSFNLSDPVLIAFITSTTASVLGLYGIAAYWRFGRHRKTKFIEADRLPEHDPLLK